MFFMFKTNVLAIFLSFFCFFFSNINFKTVLIVLDNLHNPSYSNYEGFTLAVIKIIETIHWYFLCWFDVPKRNLVSCN